MFEFLVTTIFCILIALLIVLFACILYVGKGKLRKKCWEDETDHWKAHAVRGKK